MASKRITLQKAGQMFGVWCESQSIQFVSSECAVHRDTVRRYRERDRWDERLKEIQKKAREIVDTTAAQLLAEDLKIVRYAKGKIFQALQAGKLYKQYSIRLSVYHLATTPITPTLNLPAAF